MQDAVQSAEGSGSAGKPRARGEVRPIDVRAITFADLKDAVRRGIDDFRAKPTHLFVLGLIYPVMGSLAAFLAADRTLLPLLFPIVGGYALMGPVMAIVLYDISRRREAGQAFAWGDVFQVLTSASRRSILGLAITLFVVFLIWVSVAKLIYLSTVGDADFHGVGEFFALVTGTADGLALIVLGNLVGAAFAFGVLATYVVSFPLLLDRDVGALSALNTSLRVTFASPLVIATWGLGIALSMILGGLLLGVGLAVVLPVLGHASWHVYRKAVAR